MKKRFAALLAVSAMAFAMTACGETATTTEATTAEATEEVTTTAEATEAETTEAAADEGYGKSNADATGIVDFDTLKATFDWQSGEADKTKLTYEDFKDKFGTDGAVWEGHFDAERHYYKWGTDADYTDFLYVGFNVNDDGSETYSGSTWSSSLNDAE